MAAFIDRHNGPRQSEIEPMLNEIGAKSLDDLLVETIPASIRMNGQLNLPKRYRRRFPRTDEALCQ